MNEYPVSAAREEVRLQWVAADWPLQPSSSPAAEMLSLERRVCSRFCDISMAEGGWIPADRFRVEKTR